MNRIWCATWVNLRFNIMHPLGYVALAALVIWAVSVPSVGINKADFLAREQELGYPPLSDSMLAGLGAAQVASGFMTLFGVLLFLNNLDRERDTGLGEVLASLPLSGWSMVGLQYMSNIITLLLFSLVAYLIALIVYPLREFSAFSLGEFLWPGVLFPLGSAFLLASLPLVLDVLNLHQAMRYIAYGLIALAFNLGPFALAVMTNLDHSRHPLFEVWLTSDLGLDTMGIWYVQGYLNLVLQMIEQYGTPVISPVLHWIIVVRPRLASIALGLLLAALAAWRFNRFQVASER